MKEVKIDFVKFANHVEKIQKILLRPLVVVLGGSSDLEQANLNSALFNFLIGYEFTNTVIVIDKVCKIFSHKKKLELFEDLKDNETFAISKDLSNLQDIIDSLAKLQNLCIADKNKIQGALGQSIINKIALTDVSEEIERMLLYKDNEEIDNCKKAGKIIEHLIKNCTELIKDNLLDEERLFEIIDSPIEGVNNEQIEYCFAPEISNFSYRIGIRYNGYCAEGGRTVFNDMNLFYNVQNFILGLIRPGNNSKIVYEKVLEYFQSKNLIFDDKFLYTTGLLCEEVNFKKEFRILNGLVFVIKLSNGTSVLSNTFYLDNIPVFVTPNDKFEDFLDNRPRFRDKSKEFELDIRRKEHQKELLEKLIEERLDFYKNQKDKSEINESTKKLQFYQKESEIPRKGKIVVDPKNNAVCIPIGEFLVPFHISNIKNIILVDEMILKFNFEFTNLKTPKFLSTIKSINICDRNGKRIYDEIQEMKLNFSVISDKEIIKQDKLVEKKNKVGLEDVFMRTDVKTAIKKRKTSNLELHENGFRFVDEKIDVLFSNIRHIFFVKGDVQNKTILHFNLHNPVLINSKKTKNVQFYQEASSNIVFNTHKKGDEQMEYLMEKEESDRQKRLNFAFENFISKIESETTLKVQRPKDGFYGVPFKESVTILKTHECLVALYEQPFFVLALEDIEVVNFERVVYNVKTYDVIFIFKNYTTAKISSIESSYMSKFKDYLDSNNIVYMETIFNIQWKNVIKKIQEDPVAFYENGGWIELLVEDQESEIDENESETEDEEEDESTTDSDTESEVSSSDSDTSYESDDSVVSDSDDFEDSESENNGRKKRRT